MKYVPAAILCATALLAGCGGGGSSTPAAPVASAIAAGVQTQGTVVLTIGNAAAAAAANATQRRTLFVSPSAQSVSISANGAAGVVADVSANSPNCTTSGNTRTCTIPFTLPAGNDTVDITLFAGTNGTGALLGAGSGTATVTAGVPFSITIALGAVVASVTNPAVTYSSGTSFVRGTAGTATLTVTASDAGGNAIPATASFASPVTLSSSDTNVAVSPASWQTPSQAITLTYNGSAAVANTVTLTFSSGTNALLQVPVAFGASNLYVAEFGANALTVTPSTAGGNTAPARTISGSNTGINQDYGLAVDASGATYLSALRNATITVYAPAASGNVAPARTITGANTGLNGPLGLAIDGSDELIAANFFADSVTVFAAGANGNATPVRTISGAGTGLAEPYGIALDGSGNLYVVDNASQYGGTDLVTVYAAGANGNVAPTRTITGNLTGMSGAVYDAVDDMGRLYVTNSTANTVTMYAAGATGNVAPIATISGSNTTLATPNGIAVDTDGTIYVANDGNNSILVFAAGSNGNIAPIRTISGAATGIVTPLQMTLAP